MSIDGNFELWVVVQVVLVGSHVSTWVIYGGHVVEFQVNTSPEIAD